MDLPINILVVADLEGVPGKQMSGATLLALDAINARGGVLGREVVARVIDSGTDQGDPQENLDRFRAATAETRYDAILACVASRQTLSIADAAMEAKLPFIGCASTSEVNDPARFPYYFGLTVQFDRQAAGAAMVMKQMGIGSVDILAEDSTQAESFMDHYPRELAAQGIKVNAIERFPTEAADRQQDVWRKLNGSASDYILVMGHDKHATQILQSAASAGVTHRIIGDISTGASVSDADVGSNIHPNTVFVSYSIFARGKGASGPSEVLQSMVPAFEAAAGAPLKLAPFWSAVAYDSATVWATAATRAGALDAEKIRRELESWSRNAPPEPTYFGYSDYLFSERDHSNRVAASEFTVVRMGTFEPRFKTREAIIVGES